MIALHATLGVFVLGAIRGLLIGLAGAGVVLVYRSTRIVNLAQGQLGAAAAAVMGRLIVDHGLPYFVAFPLAIAGGALLGIIIDVGVVSRLRAAPRLLVVVATVAISELCVVLISALPLVRHNTVFPTGITVDLSSGSTRFEGPEVLVLATVPAIVVALALFLALTPTGLAMRAASQNPEAAALAGMSPRRVSATVWAIAGAIAVLTGVLTQGIDRTFVAASDPGFAGSALLLSTLAAALMGGLRSLPIALGGGVAVGEVIQVMRFSGYGPARVEVFLLVLTLALVIVIALLRSAGGDADAAISLTRGRLPVPVPDALTRWWVFRRTGGIGVAALFGVAACLPFVGASSGGLFLATRVVLFAMLGLSLTVLTSWAGQLSLGQVAIYALAAGAAAKLVSVGAPFPLAVVAAVAIGAAAALLVGLPALVARGALLGIITLALAITLPDNLFSLPGLSGVDGISIERPSFARSTSRYYLLCLVALAVVTLAVAHLRTTGLARRIIGARSNPRRAASLTIDVIEARLTAFALSGAIAGLAGGLFAGLEQQLAPGQFPTFDSLLVVAIVAIGGFASSVGPLLGAVFVVGLPATFGNTAAADDLTAGLGLLLVILYLPGGIASLLDTAREALFSSLLSRRTPPAISPDSRVVVRDPPERSTGRGAPSLAAVGISLSIGARRILDGVSLEVPPGQILGLVGANGAGKSTLLSVLAGERQADGGRVWLSGREATGASPEVRAAAGMGRIFQDALLFGDLTTEETIKVALEARAPSGPVVSLLGLPPSFVAEGRKAHVAQDIIGQFGLRRYAGLPVSRLSTGTRRLVELACLVAQGADLWLLDEPTAGLAQREVEAFAPLLLRLRSEVDATVILVEHDLPLVAAVSDRLLCLGDGRMLATGTPAEVLSDPAVRAAYLGDLQLSMP